MNEAETNRLSETTGTGRPDGKEPNGTDASTQTTTGQWDRLKQQLSETTEYLSYYLDVRADELKLTGRRALFQLQLHLVILLVVAGSILLAITLIFVGVAQGLAPLFGERAWLGYMGSGILLLAGAGGGTGLAIVWSQRAARNQTVNKYEQRKQQQRARFGHDVADRAASACPKD